MNKTLNSLRNMGLDFDALRKLSSGELTGHVISEAIGRCKKRNGFDVNRVGNFSRVSMSDEMLATELNNMMDAARMYMKSSPSG